ncbi:histidine kinase [Anaeromyxobacter dehalogenans 2CP-1]|uniref:histidine kinase n=1 Tax=Anaeromyxobacter dehalogenans (strain ATCC BAA-258 / DSM 21875 / 2CP-1) TaxID=455488 RepID=B8JC39_ANAD2|nr:HAMP domain-containing sensor histidine kinase [Anaeromyxobacter dehalogenans]ACL63961.1 histidine kinase [Anaeromyxobacter dehalogenans 2CP-1]
MRRVATKIFLTFAVALAAFAAVAGFGVARLHDLRRDLRTLSSGYIPLTRIAAQLDVKDWVTARALEARVLDPAARRAYLPVARAHFPALVREKIEEGKRVAAGARLNASGDDAHFLGDVLARLDGLAARWADYDREARALLDALEGGAGLGPGAAAFDARVAAVRQLEKGLSLDVKLLQVALETQIADRVHAAERTEGNTVALTVIYSLLALAVGVGAAAISQRLLAPIQTLTEGVKAVAAGDLTRKVEARGRDEISVLAHEFNAMAASLDRQRADLLRAERLAAVGRISAQITHEIRNPLNAIGLNAELLAEEIAALPAPPAEATGLVSAISREVDRLNAVTEEYLRFARLPRPQLERHDLNEILGGLLDFLGPELAAARVAVHRALAPGLPGVRCDEGQLRAVFLNLLRNSREAMPGGGTVTVVTRRADSGAAVEAELGDTGGGIPPGDLTRIFEPFYSTKERGTGLGLAFTQQVVEEHGGTIRCESTVGRGTIFTLRFPAVQDRVEHEVGAAT